jgi:hypothetical protein
MILCKQIASILTILVRDMDPELRIELLILVGLQHACNM